MKHDIGLRSRVFGFFAPIDAYMNLCFHARPDIVIELISSHFIFMTINHNNFF